MSSKKQYFFSIMAGMVAGGFSAVSLIALLLISVMVYPDTFEQWLQNQQTSNSVTQLVQDQTGAMSNGMTQQESAVITAVNSVQPAVVSIIISKDVPTYEQYFQDPFGSGMNSPFGFQIPEYRQNGTEKQEIGGGSGFIITSDGIIVTNRHVVEDQAAEYTVFLSDGTKYDAQVLAVDSLNDIAMLKIEASDLPYLEFGNSDQLQVGQSVIAIGNALSEFENSVSVGVVSGLGRSIQAGDGFSQVEQLDNVIQTDAAINPGNSGGPLLNLRGEVIGVNVAVAYGSENIGFALPANDIAAVVESVKENGTIVRPYIGVRYIDITPELAEANGLTIDYGALVQRGLDLIGLAVVPGSPADKAGIEENDIILEVNGVKLDDTTSLVKEVNKFAVGDTITLKLLHDGEERNVQITLEQYPEQNKVGATSQE